MIGAFCAFLPLVIGDSDSLQAQVTYVVHLAWPKDTNPESPDPGERASAEVTQIELWNPERCGKFQTLRLDTPVMQPVLRDLERKLLEAFQWQ